MFQTTKKAANYFIALQYAQIDDEPTETQVQATQSVNGFQNGL